MTLADQAEMAVDDKIKLNSTTPHHTVNNYYTMSTGYSDTKVGEPILVMETIVI